MDADKYFAGFEFCPKITPQEMMQLGVFDACYFGGQIPSEFPASWAVSAVQSPEPDPQLNLFGVHSAMSLRSWQEKGWIHEADPLGWFQWYCRYYLGRRHDDDQRQIKRWVAYRRHVGMLLYHARYKPTKGIIQRQSLLHWAYDPYPDFRTLIGESLYSKILRLRAHADK
jgi:hypothetical protein